MRERAVERLGRLDNLAAAERRRTMGKPTSALAVGGHHRWYRRTGPAKAVDAYALSEIEGIRKPDTGGGRAAGLRTVWIDRGTWPDHRHDADHAVTDVPQAMEIIESER
ncbi:hypothetical protein AB0K21_38200 [Streptosporangium sp. NPDC049248]|uniref:hypothetical protein n=1 Tax=Streptosporangium sp. NPDC049248 TaxID=3155651 RepID=UPI00341EF7B9